MRLRGWSTSTGHSKTELLFVRRSLIRFFMTAARDLAYKSRMNRLIDVAVVLSGIAPPKGTGEAVSYVQIKDLRDPLGSLMRAPAPALSARRATPIDSSDILVPSRGEDLVAFRPTASMIGAYAALDVYLIRPDPKQIESAYLIVALNSDSVRRQLRIASTGSALPRIPKQALEEAQIPVPSLDQQGRIAAIGTLARRSEELHKERTDAETRLHAALISHILQSAS